MQAPILESKIPFPVCKTSLLPVIRWAKNFERAASLVNKERLTDANLTKHSNACSKQENKLKWKKKIDDNKNLVIIYRKGWICISRI